MKKKSLCLLTILVTVMLLLILGGTKVNANESRQNIDLLTGKYDFGYMNYDGNEKTVKIKIYDGNYVLQEGTDYTVSYSNNINVGTMTVTLTGIGNYNGIKTITNEILPANISNVNVTPENIDEIYSGYEIKPFLIIKNGEQILQEGIDYTVEYKNNINIGTATISIAGIGNYTGTITKNFRIYKNIDSLAGKYDFGYMNYDGNEKTVKIKIYDGNYVLQKGTDYTVSYSNNINVGTMTVTLTGIGNYSGTQTITNEILPANISNVNVTPENIDEIYSGYEIKPFLIIKNGERILQEGIDYTVTYKNNINAGTANVTITGIGNYTGTIAKTFKIVAKNLPQLKVTVNTKDKVYTGKVQKTSIVLKDGTKTLKEGTDYTVTYKNNTNVGTATVIITGIGNYTGTITKTFRIVPQKATISSIKNVSNKSAKVTWKKDTQVTGYELYMSTAKADKTYMKTTAKLTLRKSTSTSSKSLLKIPKGAKVKILKKNVKKSRGYTWYKVSYKGKTGYVASKYLETIYYEGKYSKIKTITSNRTTSYTKTKLSKGKKYTFKIRSYKVIDGKKVYGSYSNVKWITIKK